MNVRRFALIFGIIYLVVGIAGFVPPLLRAPAADAPPLAVNAFQGYLLGLFPVNLLHTLVHLAIGIWGLIAARGPGAAVIYARSLAVIYGVLAVMGLIPALNTLFGLVPLHGHDIWLHAGTALIAAYFGFARKPETQRA
jgi:hypothetical protein